MNDGDVLGRQIRARIQALDGVVIPLRDPAQVDVRKQLAGEVKIAGHAGDVVDRNDAAEDRRQVGDAEAGRGDLLIGHGAGRGAEEDRAGAELADAAARADGLIVDPHVRMQLAILAEPLRVDGVGKRRARAVDLHVLRGCREREEGGGEYCQQFLHFFPFISCVIQTREGDEGSPVPPGA